jgi:hypothetical protein
MGLRSTRATARQREVSDGGTSSVSEPESLRKTHLTSQQRSNQKRNPAFIYTPLILLWQGAQNRSQTAKTVIPRAQSAQIWTKSIPEMK